MSMNPKFFENIVGAINAVPVPDTPLNEQIISKEEKEEMMAKTMEPLQDITNVVNTTFNDLNKDICNRLQLLLKLTVAPEGDLPGLIEYINNVVAFFQKPYIDCIEIQKDLIENMAPVVLAMNNKTQELKEYFCSGDGFEFPVFPALDLLTGCSALSGTLPGIADLELPPEPEVETLDSLTCSIGGGL